MRVSFIIPVKEVNDYVVETVGHLQGLDGDNWEAFVVTNEIESVPWYDSRITVLESGRVGPADKRDLAAKFATGEILVFLDDDSYPENNYLSVLRNCFADGHQVVGGPAVTPTTDSYWQQVSGAMYLSRFTGGSPERYSPRLPARYVADWPSVNLATRTSAFERVGGFDCSFWPGEDTLLCDKLAIEGLRVWYEPNLLVWHHRRGSLLSHLKQAGNYGLHRGFFAKEFGHSSRKFAYFAPSALVLLILASVVVPRGLVSQIIFVAIFLYFLSQLIGAVQVTSQMGFRIAVGSFAYAVLSHLWYGIRFMQGLIFTRDLKSRLR